VREGAGLLPRFKRVPSTPAPHGVLASPTFRDSRSTGIVIFGEVGFGPTLVLPLLDSPAYWSPPVAAAALHAADSSREG